MQFIAERDMIHGEIRKKWRSMRITVLLMVAGKDIIDYRA